MPDQFPPWKRPDREPPGIARRTERTLKTDPLTRALMEVPRLFLLLNPKEP